MSNQEGPPNFVSGKKKSSPGDELTWGDPNNEKEEKTWSNQLAQANNVFVTSKDVVTTGSPSSSSVPSDLKENLYVSGSNFFGINRDTGTEEFIFRSAGGDTDPTIVDGVAYIKSGSGIQAIDLQSVSTKWQISPSAGGDLKGGTDATVIDGVVYFATRTIDDFDVSGAGVYAYDIETQTQKWYQETGSIFRSDPSFANGTIYVGLSPSGNDGIISKVVGFDAETGNKTFEYTEPSNSIQTAVAVVDGTLYFGSQDNNLYAVDIETETANWIYTTGSSVDSTPAVVNGTVYFGSHDGNVYALDAETGDEQWSYNTGEISDQSPTVVDGVVYIGNSNGVYAIDAETGNKNWFHSTSGIVECDVAIINNHAYFGTDTEINEYHEVNLSDGTQNWNIDWDELNILEQQNFGASAPIAGADGWCRINRPGRIGNKTPIDPF